MKISDESKVGIFVVVTLVILIIGYNFIRGKNLFEPRETFYAYYYTVDGLEVSNPVTIRGHKIGLVNKIEFDKSQDNRFKVTFSIKDDLPIPVDSRARIINLDVMGSKALEIMMGNKNQYLKKNDSLAGEVSLSLTATINNIVTPITSKTNKILAQVEKYLQGGNKINIEEVYADLAATASNLKNISAKLDEYMVSEKLSNILGNIEDISGNLKDHNDELSNAISNISQFSDSLSAVDLVQTITSLNQVLDEINQITQKINEGTGSTGMLVNNDSLYINLTQTIGSLNKLVDEINANPQDYLNISVFERKKKEKAK